MVQKWNRPSGHFVAPGSEFEYATAPQINFFSTIEQSEIDVESCAVLTSKVDSVLSLQATRTLPCPKTLFNNKQTLRVAGAHNEYPQAVHFPAKTEARLCVLRRSDAYDPLVSATDQNRNYGSQQ